MSQPDPDLDACRAAFPTLTWHWHTAAQLRGEARLGDAAALTLHIHGGLVIACVRWRGVTVWQHVAADHAAALASLRQAMTALRDDLTAALGEPPSPDDP